MAILRAPKQSPEKDAKDAAFMVKVEAERADLAKKLVDKSRLFKRAHKAFKTSSLRYKKGYSKTQPTFGSSLKWSWKIEKEEAWDKAYQDMKDDFYKDKPAKSAAKPAAKSAPAFKTWTPKPGFYRFYFSEGQYVQVSTKKTHTVDEYEGIQYEKTGYYKLVGVDSETFETHRKAIEKKAKADFLVISRY